MPKKKESIQQTGGRVANKKMPARAPMAPANSASHGLAKAGSLGAEKWRCEFEEIVNRYSKESRKQFNSIKKLMQQSIAKAQALGKGDYHASQTKEYSQESQQ